MKYSFCLWFGLFITFPLLASNDNPPSSTAVIQGSPSQGYDALASRVKVEDLAIVDRSEKIRYSLYKSWADTKIKVEDGWKASLYPSPPEGMLAVRSDMLRASSLAGEQEMVSLMENDPLRWPAIMLTVDALTKDSHTAFTSRQQDAALKQEVGRRFIVKMDENRLTLDSSQVRYLLSDQKGLSDALSGKDLGWINRVFLLIRSSAILNLERNLKELEKLPNNGLLPNACLKLTEWVAQPDVFAEPKDLNDRRLASFCVNVSSVTSSNKLNDAKDRRQILAALYQKSLARLRGLTQESAYPTFISSRLAALDPHSAYLSPDRKSNFSAVLDGTYVGVGLTLSFDDGRVKFSEVVPTGPSFESGIRVGDSLISVGPDVDNLRPVLNLSSDQVLSSLMGIEGVPVWLRVKTVSGSIVDHEVRRRRIEVSSDRIKVKKITGNHPPILHIWISNFYRDNRNPTREGGSTTEDLRRALLKASPGDWVLLDLRGNGGGFLDEALGVAGLFLPPGPVVRVEQPSGETVALPSVGAPVWNGKLAILVDRSTASASEIVAAALQDRGRAVIFGERTFGKGTAQTLMDLDAWAGAPSPVYGQLNLTTMRFFRPSGETTQINGVAPDIAFLPEKGRGREDAFDHALQATKITPDLTPVSMAPPLCLDLTRSTVNTAWSAGEWATLWSDWLSRSDIQYVQLNDRKKNSTERKDNDDRLTKALSAVPESDAPLYVSILGLSSLNSCLNSLTLNEKIIPQEGVK